MKKTKHFLEVELQDSKDWLKSPTCKDGERKYYEARKKIISECLNEVNLISVKPDVSGNEANPEIKQSGEVAVCVCDDSEPLIENSGGTPRCKWCGKDIKQTDR